ncbi:helix-turn-helix transcriptional regulator [Prosthecomicrobium sp. N25]|uniref:helix-turn-helix transcriptional regulator n=1 Tax=Prosthecomicrobium sp. N25 TaxID=3129254 RepID=UPI003077FC91
MSFAKADQLLELARMVGAHRMGVTLDDVIERFGCVLRTAQRMMSALEAVFPEVVASFDEDGRKRWRFEGGQVRELMSLTPEELAALDLAIAELRRSGSPIEARVLVRLQDKILALVPPKTMARLETDHEALLEAQGIIARPGPRPRIDDDVAAAVLEAVKRCVVLEIDYRSHGDSWAKPRRVVPYGILSGARRYLVARPVDDPDGPIRTYRLDAVAVARVGDVPFTRPEGFDLQAFANRAFGVYQNEAEYGPVAWRFRPEAADQARGYLFHPEQVLEDEPDGSLVVRFHASGHLEMCWHLYAWGDRVEVLEPAALRRMVDGYRRSDFAAMP